MSDAITAGLSRQTGLLKELRILASNVANASTEGYKREASVFTEYVSRRDEGSLSLGSLRGRYAVMEDGALRKTGGTYDLALSGRGFFAVQRGDDVLLTRAGRFQTNAEGLLVTPQGHPVLGEGGGVIEVPPESREVVVSPDGTVSIDGLATARLGVFDAPGGSLMRAGDTLWQPTEAYTFVDEAVLHQGFLEQSNVNPVMEIARLTEAQRLFEAGTDLADAEHRRLESLIRTLSEL